VDSVGGATTLLGWAAGVALIEVVGAVVTFGPGGIPMTNDTALAVTTEAAPPQIKPLRKPRAIPHPCLYSRQTFAALDLPASSFACRERPNETHCCDARQGGPLDAPAQA